jgi:hypothetical protein
MRTSREWIEQTLGELERSPAPVATPRRESARPRQAAADQLTFELTLSEEELRALQAICDEDELSPKQALDQIVRARLLGQPQFARADRARLRACLELLRALEQHVGRAARPASAAQRTGLGREVLVQELLELGGYLRQVGRGIGEAMLGNLRYWQGDAATDEPVEKRPHA